MAEFKLGRIRFIWKDEWSEATTYYKDDVVVLDLPKIGYVIKRIKDFKEGKIVLKGDNEKLHSSICDQLHNKEDIIGKVVSFKY